MFLFHYYVITPVNFQGNYSCGFCNIGYMGDSNRLCYLSDFCLSGNNKCNNDSTCVYISPGIYDCEVCFSFC